MSSTVQELTTAELDIVAGGLAPRPAPRPTGGNLLEEVIADILRIVEPKQPAQRKALSY